MVSSLEGNDGSMVPRIDKRKVVAAHLRKPLSVFVDKGRLENGISSSGRREVNDSSGINNRRSGGIVGPFISVGDISDREEECLDRVRETDVVTRADISGRRKVCLPGSSLDLFDKDITRSTTHLLTFLVRNDSVVSPDLNIDKLGGGTAKESRSRGGLVGIGSGSKKGGVSENKKLSPVPEGKGDTHLIVRESGSGKSNTAVTREEEGKGEIEGERIDSGVETDAKNSTGKIGKVGLVSDHVIVTVPLSGGDRKGRPEIKMVGIEAGSYKVVERDATLLKKGVHEIPGPSNSKSTTRRSNSRERDPQPRVEEVVSGARNIHRPFLVKRRGSRCLGKTNRDLSEPRGLPSLADEISGGLITRIKVLLQLIISSEINETAGKITLTKTHSILYTMRKKFFLEIIYAQITNIISIIRCLTDNLQ
jgi:hypothetical protein